MILRAFFAEALDLNGPREDGSNRMIAGNAYAGVVTLAGGVGALGKEGWAYAPGSLGP